MNVNLSGADVDAFMTVLGVLLISNAGSLIGWIYREIKFSRRLRRDVDAAHGMIRELKMILDLNGINIESVDSATLKQSKREKAR